MFPDREQIKSAWERGELTPEALRSRLAALREAPDPDLHLAWADLLEELGLPEEAALELHLALRDAPERLELYDRLGELYLDQGQPLKAAHMWNDLVKRRPGEARPYQELGRALEEAGAYDKALEAYQAGRDKTGDPQFDLLLQNLAFLKEPAPPPEAPAGTAQLLPQPHHLVTFLNLFAAREGVFARQWVSPTGESGYTPVHEPMTPKVAENHILGNYTIGVYPVRLDNTVTFLAFDFDLAKFAVNRAITSARLWAGLMAKVHQAACRLLDVAAAHDLPAYLEDSGFKGRHVWIFLDTPVPAGVAKKAGDLLARQLLPLPPEVTLEVFPKQAVVKTGSLGNLIKLPLGLHRKTGKRALFIQPDGQPYEDQLAFLGQVAKAPRSRVYAAVQRLASAAAPPPVPEIAPEPPPPDAAPPPSSPEPPYDLERDPQLQYLLLKCPTLKALVDRLNQTAQVTKEETLVLMHTLGHLEHGPAAVNALFQRCLNADPTLFLKSRFAGNPMSCPKIRARIPHLTSQVACNCAFNLTTNLYPTPLIHVQEMKAGVQAAPLGLTLDSLQFQHLLKDYLRLRQQWRETQILLDRLEARLAQAFQEAGVEEMHTPLGRLRLKKEAQGKPTFLLEM
jgi:tetratricopeptide (TPR) repeat protein